MSEFIGTAFVKQYHGVLDVALQQKGSRLRMCVRNESQHSEEQFWEQLGTTEVAEIVDRHGDSPLVSTPHDRRRVTLRFWDWGEMIDTIDRVRMLIDPASAYIQNAVFALGRNIDRTIFGVGGGVGTAASPFGGMFGIAYTGKNGTTETAFDSTNFRVAVNYGGATSGLTVAKLRRARTLLRAAENDPSEAQYVAVTAIQEDNLLATTQVTSSDYNTVRALVSGEVNSFLGFQFEHTELVPLDEGGNSYRRLPFWVKSGLLLAMNPEIKTEVERRADKRFGWYAYAAAGMGAVRMRENKVGDILCSESV